MKKKASTFNSPSLKAPFLRVICAFLLLVCLVNQSLACHDEGSLLGVSQASEPIEDSKYRNNALMSFAKKSNALDDQHDDGLHFCHLGHCAFVLEQRVTKIPVSPLEQLVHISSYQSYPSTSPGFPDRPPRV